MQASATVPKALCDPLLNRGVEQNPPPITAGQNAPRKWVVHAPPHVGGPSPVHQSPARPTMAVAAPCVQAQPSCRAGRALQARGKTGASPRPADCAGGGVGGWGTSPRLASTTRGCLHAAKTARDSPLFLVHTHLHLTHRFVAGRGTHQRHGQGPPRRKTTDMCAHACMAPWGTAVLPHTAHQTPVTTTSSLPCLRQGRFAITPRAGAAGT